MSEAGRGMRLGLLVVTTQRVIFFALIRKELWIELGYDVIESVSIHRSTFTQSITLVRPDQEIVFCVRPPLRPAARTAAGDRVAPRPLEGRRLRVSGYVAK